MKERKEMFYFGSKRIVRNTWASIFALMGLANLPKPAGWAALALGATLFVPWMQVYRQVTKGKGWLPFSNYPEGTEVLVSPDLRNIHPESPIAGYTLTVGNSLNTPKGYISVGYAGGQVFWNVERLYVTKAPLE